MIPDTIDILTRLVAFPTLSRQSNLALLDYVEGLLDPAGIRLQRYASDDGTRANLWASVGPVKRSAGSVPDRRADGHAHRHRAQGQARPARLLHRP